MPCVFLARIHALHVTDGVRINHIECQMNNTVATLYMVGVGVVTAFAQGLVAKRNTVTLTNRLLDVRVGDAANRQIQDMFDAVVAFNVCNRLVVTS